MYATALELKATNDATNAPTEDAWDPEDPKNAGKEIPEDKKLAAPEGWTDPEAAQPPQP